MWNLQIQEADGISLAKNEWIPETDLLKFLGKIYMTQIHYFNHYKVYNSVGFFFSITIMYKHHHDLIPDHVHHHETYTLNRSLPILSLSSGDH